MRNLLRKMRRYATSFVLPVILAIPLSTIFSVIEKYVFADWEFLKFLIVSMTIDTGTSWWYHIKQRTFSSKGFAQLFTKIIIYSILLIVAHIFGAYTVNGESFEQMKWFRTFICTALIVRESISIVENVNKIKPGIIPEKIARYLKDYDETGKFNKPN